MFRSFADSTIGAVIMLLKCILVADYQDQIKAGFLRRKTFGKLKSTIKKPTEVGHVYSI